MGELVIVDELTLGLYTVLVQVDDHFETSSLCRDDVYFRIHFFGIDIGGAFIDLRQHGKNTVHLIGWAGYVNNITRGIADRGFIIAPVGFDGFISEMSVWGITQRFRLRKVSAQQI